MLNFRQDKVGFFSGLTLWCLLGVTVVAPLLIVLIGGWDHYHWLIKLIWGTVWVLMITTVLVRVAIYRWQMLRGKAPNKLPEGSPASTEEPKLEDNVPTPASSHPESHN